MYVLREGKMSKSAGGWGGDSYSNKVTLVLRNGHVNGFLQTLLYRLLLVTIGAGYYRLLLHTENLIRRHKNQYR